MIWPDDLHELVEFQRWLGETHQPTLALGKDLRIGGCFVCFGGATGGAGSAGDPGWAAAAVMMRHRLIDTATVTGSAGAPYVPGVLAAREGRLLHHAVGSLHRHPDVLLVNASGRDHPRRAGMATHLGWVLDVPTIGVTHRPLAATGEWPPEKAGAASPLFIGDEQVGWWVRTRRSARPLAVSPGWRMDLTAGLEVMVSNRWQVRTPEPIRISRRLAREARNLAG